MLRVYASKSADQAKDYFKHELTKGDYYAEGQEIVGVWGGHTAEWLGLQGTVDHDAFNALVDNTFPESTPMAGEQITQRNAPNRRAGYDINFHCPKSVSLLYEYSEDSRILDAFRDAVHSTMTSIEEGMYARVREGGVNEERQTGNLAYAEFVHFTARPVKDSEPDPHLHAHCFVPNLTYDVEEDKWKAGEFGHIKTDAPYYEALFHSHLSKSLSEMGLDVAREDKFWTLEGLDKETLKKFSQRTDQIEGKAEELGLTSDKAKDSLGASTRGAKQKGSTRDELREAWWQRLDDNEKELLDKLSEFEPVEDTKPPNFTAEETVEFSIKHKLERQSVCSVNRLKETALRQGFGEVSPDQVEQAFNRNDDLIIVGDQATTQDILAQENQIIRFTTEGYAKQDKLNPSYRIDLVTDYSTGDQFDLTDEQKNVVNELLDSRHRVQAIQGKAGTGKTTTLATLIDGIEQGGGSATLLAPTADAAYDTLKTDGDKYHCESMQNATTLARYFVDEKLWQESHGNTLIVDEAGLMSVDDMHTLFSLANQFDNRVVLVGDTSQHNSVMRGDAFRMLQQEAGLEPVSLEAIRRQSGDYREAVKAVSQGNLVDGFNKLDAMGNITVEADDDKRYQTLAERYADVIQSGNTALTVAPTHAEGEKATAAIRDTLKVREHIQGDEHTLTRFNNRNLTEAERGDSFNFDVGQMVRFQQNAKGEYGRINRSDEFTVSNVDRNAVWITDQAGQEQALDLTQAKKYFVYEKQDLQLASGDQLRITEGHKSKDGKRLNNGAIYSVDSITDDGDIRLDNGFVVDGSKGNFNQGYVATSMVSQGKTIQHVFLAQGTDYGGAVSAEQFYVSMSRGKKSVDIFTDDKDVLRDQIQHSHQRTSATELMSQANEEKDDVSSKGHLVASLEFYASQLMNHLRDTADDFLAAFRRSHQQPESTKWRDYLAQRDVQQEQPQHQQQDRELTL